MEYQKNFSKKDLDKFNEKIDSKYSKGKYNIPKLNTYLNETEKKNLSELERVANVSKKISEHKRDILNLSIREFINNWATNNIDIFSDCVKFFGNITNYKGYFNDIDATGNWTTGIYVIIKDFIEIFKKDLRSIYFGVTLVLISLLLYFIQITS